jgi:hypothetical protein
MDGLGRLLGLQAMSGDDVRRRNDDEWHALHRRPDVPPPIEPAVVTETRHRDSEPFWLRHLVTRFARR